MKIDKSKLEGIDGLKRLETTSREQLTAAVNEIHLECYPHDQLYGEICPIHGYINCPPELVFDYMSNLQCLQEWTISVRNFKPCHIEGVHEGIDILGGNNTRIFGKVVANKEALTVDYHCAWDQGEELWMIYLMRIVPAELVLKKPGSMIFWQNCKHPNYTNNPYQDKAPKDRPVWVGDLWPIFYGGHLIEFYNLKKILEYRYANNIPVGPYVLEE